MDQIGAVIHEYAPLITGLLVALSGFLGTLLSISEKLALNDNVKYSGIVHFFKLAVPALRVVKEEADTAAETVKEVEKEVETLGNQPAP